ncbi:hypothetical protein [Persicitalea jodogahamensis]|uniref:Uncharacterized protein n=1 Tax=Persicitalea jodogahamensis TaxID=402147 RepID=A0A8J3D6I0_9BACT|nr:hypothetical protein [Persicitalea jodogahamensis]GHB80959.1 hypothetical protein GCM10007390_39510 [Persicitalea jodogahamensis]
MTNEFYIQINVSDEQKSHARRLVEHSLANHRVANIWDRSDNKKVHTRMLRYTGSLGEVVFADFYQLPRPQRSFGAVDGQDWGQDFVLRTEDGFFSLDIKAMKRQTGILAADYVLNIPASQLHKPNSRTTHYFCLSFHQSEQQGTVASLLGFVDKEAVEKGELGVLYRAGTKRIRADRTEFMFQQDTYEILFKDVSSPIITERIEKLVGFRKCKLKEGHT